MKRELAAPWAHSTAIVDTGATIGGGTKIWHFSHICGQEVTIGENCSFGQSVYVGNRVAIGNGVRVQNNVSIYDRVVLEDFVFCGPSMVFTNVINPRSHIPRKNEYLKTLVRQGATLGANCTIVCGVEIGRFAFVAAGSVVTKSVPAFALVAGVPARIKGWMCHCGVGLEAAAAPSVGGKRISSGPSKLQCEQCGSQYSLSEESLQPIELRGCFVSR